MNPTNELYLSYEPMVHKFVNEYSEQYNVDKDELLGEALIIFCKAAKSFDSEKKVAFSTHLWHQLRDLTSKAFKEANTLNLYYSGSSSDSYITDVPAYKQFNEGIFELAMSSIDFSNTKSDLMYDIALQLSTEAQTYISDLLTGYYQEVRNDKGGRPQTFPINKICDRYNWTKKQANSVRSEITEWWAEYRMVS